MVQAAFAAVTLTGGVDERQIARLTHQFAGLWISALLHKWNEGQKIPNVVKS